MRVSTLAGGIIFFLSFIAVNTFPLGQLEHVGPFGQTSILLRPLRSFVTKKNKVVLASTQRSGYPQWGLTVAEAELACAAIAKTESEKLQSTVILHPFVDSFMDRLLNLEKDAAEEKSSVMVEGHLMSIESKEEVGY